MLNKPQKNIFYRHGELLYSLVFAIGCVLIFLAFPVSNNIQGSIALISFMFLAPVLYIKIILKKSLKDFGMDVADYKSALLWGGLAIVVSVLLSLMLIKVFHTDIFSLPNQIKKNFGMFVFYELVIANVIIFVLEFFFFGFLFFLLEEFQEWAILMASILLLIFLAVTNNFHWITVILPSVVVAHKTKSFVYGYASSMLAMIFFDTYLIFISK